MGSYGGHILPGSFFLSFGIWHFLNILRINSFANQANYRSTTWFPIPFKRLREIPMEPMVKIIATLIGFFLELKAGNWRFTNQQGDFTSINNQAHCAMYTVFMIWSTVELLVFYKVLNLPSGSEHVFASIAFIVEGILFLFHVDGRPKLDQQLHSLLYMVILVTAVVLLLEAWAQTSLLLLLIRVFLIQLQGTWFIQIAHCLYGHHPWKNTSSNRGFVGIAFSWHVVAILIFMIASSTIVSLTCKAFNCCNKQQHLLGNPKIVAKDREENLEMASLLGEQWNGVE